MKTLYKRTSTGAVQTWRREIDGSRYRSVSGQLDGAQVESGWVQAVSKNVGRSNETTPEEQAILECDAAYTLKLNQGGYHESIDDIDKPKFFKPMLAKNYNDHPVTFPVFSQPKLDGVRCITTVDGMWTRQGKPIESCPHILEQLQGFFQEHPEAILDGELYADKLSQDFNEIISLVRKKNPTAAHFTKTASTIEYHVYDFPSAPGVFSERTEGLFELDPPFRHTRLSSAIVWVETCKVQSQEELDDLNSQYLKSGYEGQMVRLDEPYKNSRSAALLKRKEFIDKEFTIVSINEGEGNRAGMAGFITYELGDGRQFGSGIKGSFDYAKTLLDNADQYAGGQGTVRYFELTPDGIPRFPVTIAVYEKDRDL